MLNVILWASAFAGIRVALQSFSPQSIALLRYLIASLVLIIYALITHMPLPKKQDLPLIALLGFLGFAVYNVALNAGESEIPAGTASFIISFDPIFMALLAFLIQKERLTKWGWGGILLSFGGVTIISFTQGSGFTFTTSALLVLLAAFSKSLYSIGQRQLLKTYGPLNFVTYAIWAGTLFLLVFTPGLITDLKQADLQPTLAVIYMGILPGALGYLAWSTVLSRLPSSVAGSFLYLVPLFTVLIAWVWLGEIPHITSLLGGLLILAGTITVNRWGVNTSPGFIKKNRQPDL
jgi:drug/metabolite transporter (DMT)-like permease